MRRACRPAGAGADQIMSSRVEIYAPGDEFESSAAREILRVIGTAVRERGVCVIALSGGETPRTVYRRMASLPDDAQPDWRNVHVLFGDERMVPPDDRQSNFGMVRRELLSTVAVPEANVHPIRTEMAPEEAASAYASELRSLFARTGPRCDLILLGLGEDGHTASLFPGTNALSVRGKEACAVYVPSLASWRVTLTLEVITSAHQVLFIVTGMRKAAIVRRVQEARAPDQAIPATLVRLADGLLTWMLDTEAASALSPSRL